MVRDFGEPECFQQRREVHPEPATVAVTQAAPGTVEAWGRSPDNPVGGWYGLRNGYRGRFGMYLPPLLETLGLAEVTHHPRNNRMRAIRS